LERVLAHVASRSPTQRDADKHLFAATLNNDLDRADFARFGWESALNLSAIFTFWEGLDDEIFEGIDGAT